MYSLVSSPVIGFDLIRHPHGTAVAGVLLEALALDDHRVECFDTSGVDDAERGAAWFEVNATRGSGMAEALRAVREALAGRQGEPGLGAEGATRSPAASTQPTRSFDAVLSRLQTAGIGDLDDLLNLVQADILDWAPRELATLAGDAVAVAYAGGALSRQASRRLSAPWIAGWQVVRDELAVSRSHPEHRPPGFDSDMGPLDGELRALLDRVGRLSADELDNLAEPLPTGAGSWAPLVHEATWAAYLCGRLRPVAVAQLRLVQELRRSGAQADRPTFGVWNVVSGCVQALAVRDLLPDETFEALTDAWRTKVGPLA